MDYTKIDDAELVVLSQKGDTEAFDELLVRTTPRTKALLMKQFKQPHFDYDEAVQKASIRAWQNIEKYSAIAAFSTWFFQIAKRLLLDEISRGNKMKKATSLVSELTDEHEISNVQSKIDNSEINNVAENASEILSHKESLEEKRKLIEETLASLNPKHVQVFDLIFNKNLSYKEAAEICGCSIGTVMSRVFFARKYAQRYLKNRVSHTGELIAG